MRFAGQRFRAEQWKYWTFPSRRRLSSSNLSYRYQPQLVYLSLDNAMPEFTANKIAKTAEPNFNIGSFEEPEFRA